MLRAFLSGFLAVIAIVGCVAAFVISALFIIGLATHAFGFWGGVACYILLFACAVGLFNAYVDD